MSYDVTALRQDFPILQRRINDRPLIYLDSAATSLKPRQVIAAVVHFYEQHCANIHRGVHLLSQEASELYEEARYKVARFVGAMDREIIFVRNATEALNLVARCLPLQGKVLTTLAEHHSNLLPWGENERVVKATLTDRGLLDMDDLAAKLAANHVSLVAVNHVSNGLGTINPVVEIGQLARDAGAYFLVDGSQSVPHMPVSVKSLDCDFLVFSGHKMLGPSGIGVLYGRAELLEKMEPFLLGGDMISEVHADSYQLANIPWKFEAGTPNIEGAIGLGAAVEYLQNVGMANIRTHEKHLVGLALEGIKALKTISLYGSDVAESRGGVITFKRAGLAAHALAKLLSNRYSILVRSGYHCAQPLFEAIGSGETCRASLYLYNTEEEVATLVEALATLSSLV